MIQKFPKKSKILLKLNIILKVSKTNLHFSFASRKIYKKVELELLVSGDVLGVFVGMFTGSCAEV